MPVEYETARPRYFGVFRPAKALAPVFRALRETTGYAVESVAVHSTARVELYRLRRELAALLAQRAESARLLGEAVYADDEEGTKTAREQLAELDGLVSAKEEEMERTAADAMERIQRAQLQVQPTQIEPPAPGRPSRSRSRARRRSRFPSRSRRPSRPSRRARRKSPSRRPAPSPPPQPE